MSTSDQKNIELNTERVGHRFGRRILFRRVDLNFAGGHSAAITGSNGSGKSTFVQILAGLLRPTRGDVSLKVDGRAIEDEVRPLSCGLVAPYLNVYDGFTPRENLNFLAKARGLKDRDERVSEVLDQVQILARADDVVSTFSSGMLQRVRIACALLSDPPVLLLDEPTATLDVGGIAMVRRVIDSSLADGKIVIVATNEKEEALSCERQIDVEDYL